MPPPKSTITLRKWRKKCTTKVPAVFSQCLRRLRTFSEEKVSETFKKTLIRFAVDNPTFSTGLSEKGSKPCGSDWSAAIRQKSAKGVWVRGGQSFRLSSPNVFGGSTPPKTRESAYREPAFDCVGAVKRNALEGARTVLCNFPILHCSAPRFLGFDAPKIALASQKPRLCSRTKLPEYRNPRLCLRTKLPENRKLMRGAG